MRQASLCLAAAIACALTAASALQMPPEAGYSRSVTPGLALRHERHFGRGSRERLESWREFVRRSAMRTDHEAAVRRPPDLLAPVNRFVNRLPGVSDAEHWGQDDYWATPSESYASHGADCEDFAIAKYFALKELGVPVSRLRLVYAAAGGGRGAHMVLAYYPSEGADPLILDNLYAGIEPASERTDLVPVYSFNDEDLLIARSGDTPARASPLSSRKWRGVVERLLRELAA
jgi:predicted transglutaminase-like cysteine proteinase